MRTSSVSPTPFVKPCGKTCGPFDEEEIEDEGFDLLGSTRLHDVISGMTTDKRLCSRLLPALTLMFFWGGCKDEANKGGASVGNGQDNPASSNKAKKGYVSEEPQLLFDVKTGKQTSLTWEANGKAVKFKVESFKGEGTHVHAVLGQEEVWLHTCAPEKSDGGRVEVMVRPDPDPEIVEHLHVLCISAGANPTTKGVRYYLDRNSEKFETVIAGTYEKEGVFYEPLEKHAAALHLQTLSAGDNHSCGIRKDGTAVCWGDSVAGATIAPEDERFTMIDVNVLQSCGLKTDKSIRCWGDGTNIGGETIKPPQGSYLDIALGHSQMCAIDTAGETSCWWTAPPKERKKDTATDILLDFGLDQGSIKPPPGDFTNIQADYSISCGLLKEGAIKCWGRSVDGLIAKIPEGTFKQFSLGVGSACALRSDGTLACWGALRVPPPTGAFTQVDVGSSAACAIASDGKIKCWGSDDSKQLEPPTGSFRFVSVGDRFACAIRKDDTVECWGNAGRAEGGSEKTALPLY